MQTKQNDMSPGDAQAALAWLIEMGADEIVGEAPVNRFAVAVAPPVVAAPVAEAAPAQCRPFIGRRLQHAGRTSGGPACGLKIFR